MNPSKLQQDRLSHLANQVYDLKDTTERKIDSKFAQIEGVLTEVKEVKTEVKDLAQTTRNTLSQLENRFEEHSNEVVDIIREIKENGLKGDKGEDANEEAIEERLLAKIPTIEKIVKELPTEEEIAEKVIKLIPENKPSLKIIQESIDIEKVADKVKEELDIPKLKKDIQKEVKLEVSRNKAYQQVSGGGFNNIANASGTVSTGLSTLKFTGSGVNSVSQSGSTVTVDISGGVGSGITSINADATAAQLLVTGTSGTDFAIADNGTGTHTFNLPVASATNTGKLSSTDWSTFNNKGSGTVTSFAFTDANGFDGTVANSTTTPTLSLTTTVSDTRLMYSNAGGIAGISGATSNGTAVTYTTGNLLVADVKASGSGGVEIKNSGGTSIIITGAGAGTGTSIIGTTNIGSASADYIQIAGGTGATTQTATGSSTDIDITQVPKGAGKFKVTGTANVSSLTASQIMATNASKDLVTLDTATYPSLTELSYVKGVTSAIQTQLNAKGAGSVTSIDVSGGTTGLTFSGGPITTSGTITMAGTLDVDNGGTGQTSYTNGQLLIGNTTGNTLTKATLTGTSNQVVVTNGAGSITLSTPQDIATTSNPQFATIELGAATDTTISRSAAGQIAVEGVQVATISNTVTLTNKIIRNTVEPGSDDTYTGEDITGFNATATIAQWDAVYLSTTGWALTDADAASTAGGVMVGLAAAAGTNGNPLTVVTRGVIRNDGWTWTTVGAPLYLSTTAGALTETAPSGTDDVVRIVGYVMSDDCIFFNPSNDWITRV